MRLPLRSRSSAPTARTALHAGCTLGRVPQTKNLIVFAKIGAGVGSFSRSAHERRRQRDKAARRHEKCDGCSGAMCYRSTMTGLYPINDVLAAEPMIRLGVFAVVLTLLVTAEIWAPRRKLAVRRQQRWPGNVGVVVLSTLLIRILFPTAAVGLALVAEANSWGLLNLIDLQAWLAIPVAIVLLDLIIYGQHVLLHTVPWLWRLHRMHHADIDIDVTTGFRFHPAEIVLSMMIKLCAVALLGVPALAIMIFEVLLNTTSMFNHSNIRLSASADARLRHIIVTPDMHRVHHSIVTRETNANFGFNLPWWDHWFGTYCAQPQAGHEAMTIGLAQFREPSEFRLDRMLLQPLRRARDDEGSR